MIMIIKKAFKLYKKYYEINTSYLSRKKLIDLLDDYDKWIKNEKMNIFRMLILFDN